MKTKIERRALLRGAAIALGATAGGSLLGACTDAGQGSSGGQPKGPVILPSYRAAELAPPDLAAAAQGLPPGYLRFPAEPPSADRGVPGTGETLQSMQLTNQAPAPGLDSNRYWQELNKRLGVTLNLNSYPREDYQAKVTTTVAGGELPDTVQLFPGGMPNFTRMLEDRFQNLAEHLSGDAILEYPYLAALPTSAWQNVAFNGGLWGIPYAQPRGANIVMVRRDIIEKRGLPLEVRDGAEFMELCRGLTDPKKNQWAFTDPIVMFWGIRQMTGTPNVWQVENGKFISEFETDQYRQALDIMARLWKEGLVYPDAFSGAARYLDLFGNGTTGIVYSNFSDWSHLLVNYRRSQPDLDIAGVLPFNWDGGGQAGMYLMSGIYTFTALKKTDSERIKKILKVLNWLAAPFGSDVYEFTRYGLPDRHFTLKGTDPIRTPEGTAEVAQLNVNYLASPGPVIYVPGEPEVTKTVHEFVGKSLAKVVELPTVGLHTESSSSGKAKSAATNLDGIVSDVIQGRRSLADFDKGVQEWLSAIGNTMRAEFEVAYAERQEAAGS